MIKIGKQIKVVGIIWNFIKNLFKNHKKGIAIGFAGAAAGLGSAGIFEGRKAKRINRNAMDIRNEALSLHDTCREQVSHALEELGNAELAVTDSFSIFADAIGRIKGCPSFKTKVFTKIKLPDVEIQEFKVLSNELRMAIDTIGGAAAGAAAGLAALGVTGFIAAPGALGAGIVLCAKGVGLHKKANKNLREAKALQKQVDEIIGYYSDLENGANTLRNSIELVYRQYLTHLNGLIILVDQNQDWKSYSKAEKQTVENTVRLAKMLFEMCKVDLVIEPGKESELEKVNEKEINKVAMLANNLITAIA